MLRMLVVARHSIIFGANPKQNKKTIKQKNTNDSNKSLRLSTSEIVKQSLRVIL
jgi:hypothetical protein